MNRVVIAETLRRQVSPGPIIYLFFIVVMTALTPQPDAPGAVWRPMLVLLIIISGAQLIGPEFSSGTLQLILAKPVNRSVYAMSRIAGVALAMWIVIWVLVGVETVALLNVGHASWTTALIAGINTMAKALLMCTLLAFFGSFSRAYFNVAYYFLLQLFLTATPAALRLWERQTSGFLGWVGSIVRHHPGIISALVFIDTNLFPTEPRTIDRSWLLLVASNAAIAIVGTCLIFRRREVPYGAD